MLSPGDWWKRVPKSPRENLRFRRWLLDKCSKNRRTREAVVEACRNDILFYVNAFVWTHHPKQKPRVVPFITWPFQDRALRNILDHIDKQRDLVMEKSRDMGGTWLFIAADDWVWMSEGHSQSLLVSREGELVDGKTPDALMPKLDFIHDHLPEWMMPRGWKEDKHRLRKFFENPENHATITGQATTEKIGIGGRATVMFVDEFSRIDRDFDVLYGTADTADCRIFNSTHTGTGTAFYSLTTNGVTDKLVMHWTEHPEKAKGKYRYDNETNAIEVLDKSYFFPPDFNFVMDSAPNGGPFPGVRSPWYDAQCVRRGNARAIAVDLDINPRGSTAQFFDSHMIRRLQLSDGCDPSWRGDVSIDPTTGKPLSLVPSPSGKLKIWATLRPDGFPPPAPYAAGADIAWGTGATPSCVSFGNCNTGEKVAEFTDSRVEPKDLAPIVVAMCWLFKDEYGEPAKIAWEIPGPGVSFGGKILELGYRNIYYRTAEMPDTMAVVVSDRPGWVNDGSRAQELLLDDYRAALSQGEFVNHSEAALEECLLFRYTNKGTIEHAEIESKDDPTGARMNHGDHVIADALCFKMMKGRGKTHVPEAEQVIPPNCLAWRRQFVDNQSRQVELWA